MENNGAMYRNTYSLIGSIVKSEFTRKLTMQKSSQTKPAKTSVSNSFLRVNGRCKCQKDWKWNVHDDIEYFAVELPDDCHTVE